MPIIHVLEESAGRVLALRVSGGRSGGSSPAEVARRAEEIASRHGALRLLVEVDGLGFLEAASLRSQLPLATRLAGRVERVAVIGDQGWLRAALKSAPEGPTEVRHFPADRAGDAREWLNKLPDNDISASV
ncbi:MAG TPA: STAS/SEC14 domain-containing protein [Gemmatimonadota bacterium]|nr:STAS/SEC14 domain-containing protein [Gemmatimonadota bacterium]